MNRMTDGITNYGALPGSIYDQPPEESEAVFVPPEFAGSFSADSKYPTSRDSSLPNSGAHDSAATPTMSESLAQRRRDMVARCTEEAKRAGKKLLFGMTTSLALQSVPIPADCDLDSAKLHTVSSVKSKRFRTRHAPLQTHIWKHAAKAANVEMNQHVFALDLFHVWAQLAPYVSFESLIVLGDAVIAATSKQPVLAKDRDAAAIYQDLVRFVEQFTRFRGRPSCVRALPLISPGADSPKESEERLSLVAHGIPQPVANYVVPDAAFASGAPITLDLAWPEFKVAVEYDGDHHRRFRKQYVRDQQKRRRLRQLGWTVIEVFADDLWNTAKQRAFAQEVATAMQIPLPGRPQPSCRVLIDGSLTINARKGEYRRRKQAKHNKASQH